MWIVPLGNVMEANGVVHLLPYVLACGGLSTFVSPLMVAALADQRVAPTRVMVWLCVGTAAMLMGTCHAIGSHASAPIILGWALALAMVSSPIWSLSTSIVLGQLHEPGREFGPVRAWATVGWMVGGWVVSLVLKSDDSVVSGYAAAGLWLVAAIWTASLPKVRPPDQRQKRTWREVMGIDALQLLRDSNHRMVCITAALYNMPLAAFYPYCVIHLKELQVPGQTAVISLGQITEVIVMLGLARLMARYRLKWVFLSGIAFGLMRYVFFSLDGFGWVLMGILVHGLAYTLYYITTQIYLEERVDRKWRARAQALLTLLSNGVGNLLGFLASGAWYAYCRGLGHGVMPWPTFWAGLAGATAVVLVVFAVFYKGQPAGQGMAEDRPHV